jgi:hypothetical protein
MKGVIGKALSVLGCASALAGAGGCYHYNQIVDPCYPERYWASARQGVNEAMAPQVYNGHVLDQTVWNYHFEPGTDKLTEGGQIHLAYLARRRPIADPCLFLQTAHDIAYNADNPGELTTKRADLDQKRVVAIKNYLAAQTAGGHPMDFVVQVHNPPPDTGISSVPVDNALRIMYTTSRGILPATGAGSVSGGAGVGAGAAGGIPAGGPAGGPPR